MNHDARALTSDAWSAWRKPPNERLADAFTAAMEHNVGWLLAPEVSVCSHPAKKGIVVRAESEHDYVEQWVDSYVMKMAREPQLLFREAYEQAGEIADRTWHKAWDNATSDYMVKG